MIIIKKKKIKKRKEKTSSEKCHLNRTLAGGISTILSRRERDRDTFTSLSLINYVILEKRMKKE